MKKPQSKYKIVMLIDDNEIDNMINQKMLESVHFADRYYIHTSGKSALDFLENIMGDPSLSEKIPDLILLDINMPLMDGIQFLEELKAHGNQMKKVDVYMLTTSINPSDKVIAEQYDAVKKFLTKPLTLEQLYGL